MAEIRLGLGFDSHARAADRTLVLGGVVFEGEPGLTGHSDADVVCHALADALLGAAALGDLGDHFPDTDPAVEGIGGLEVLATIVNRVGQAGWAPRSCDLVVVADRPALSPHREAIRRNLAGTLGVEMEAVSLKATRPEGLSLAGEGAACFAVAVLSKA